MKGEKESYDEGYKCGRNWKDSHIPGGPYADCDESRKLRSTWLQGWHDGIEVNRYKSSENIKSLLARI